MKLKIHHSLRKEKQTGIRDLRQRYQSYDSHISRLNVDKIYKFKNTMSIVFLKNFCSVRTPEALEAREVLFEHSMTLFKITNIVPGVRTSDSVPAGEFFSRSGSQTAHCRHADIRILTVDGDQTVRGGLRTTP